MSMTEQQLIGRWRTDPTDSAALSTFGEVVLTFGADGKLAYVVNAGNKQQVILLLYRVEDSVLITTQPSAPREERSRFSILSDGRLVVHGPDGRTASMFIRESAS